MQRVAPQAGRPTAYLALAAHVSHDWRGVAVLAARVDHDDVAS
jgi:hypothetical protein